MDFYIDSASIDEIKKAESWGILNGVTTNPSLVARVKRYTGKKFAGIIKEICEAVPDLPVSVEVLSTTSNEMIEEGIRIAQMSESGNIVVKLPCIPSSLPVIKELKNKDIKTNLTLCFSPLQALLVAKAGATMVSPFVGRIDDIGDDGMGLVSNIKGIYLNYQLSTKVLVASVRNPVHILNAARLGADIVTVPLAVIEQLMKHPLTEIGVAKFLEDARNASQDVDK